MREGARLMANSKRRCSNCKKSQLAETMYINGVQAFCSKESYIDYCGKNSAKLTAKGKKITKAVNKARKESIKKPSEWQAEAQREVNKYIRMRDMFKPCISCGNSREQVEKDQGWKVGGCWDAGHYQGRGKKSQLRFVLFNIHKQCKTCNGGSGKFSHKAATVEQNYKINLIAKIGIEKVEWLENNNELDLHRNDIEYFKRVKKIFAKKARIYKRIRELKPIVERLAA